MKNAPIKLIEDHDQAYYLWNKAKIQGKVLLHFDAHIDFGFHKVAPACDTFKKAKTKSQLIRELSTGLMYAKMNMDGDKKLTNIGNYVFPAMRDGIVTDFYWIIPGSNETFVHIKEKALNILKSLKMQEHDHSSEIIDNKTSISMRIYGRTFIITTVEGLDDSLEDVLLDIDTDFLTTECITKARADHDAGKRRPWLLPEELISNLKEKSIKPCYITIAYSVNGGYTPLIYKFLGDELSIFIKGTSNSIRYVLAAKNKALELLSQGKTQRAITIFEDILGKKKMLETFGKYKSRFTAHICFALFRAYLKGNDQKKMKQYYTLALKNDNSYNCKDNNYGVLLKRNIKKTNSAIKEYEAILKVNKNNVNALLGLGELFLRKKDIDQASSYYKKAYKLNKKDVLICLGLAKISMYNKKYKKAIEYIEKHKNNYMYLGAVNNILATAYDFTGQREKAFYSYKIALRFGMNLDFFMQFVKFLKHDKLPVKQRQWVFSRINFFNGQKQRLTASLNKKGSKRNISLIKRIEKELAYVK